MVTIQITLLRGWYRFHLYLHLSNGKHAQHGKGFAPIDMPMHAFISCAI